jgi:hypothetical protein
MSGKRDWRHYNGLRKPMTTEQAHQLLAEEFGIEPQWLCINGQWGWGYKREQFEPLWRLFGIE